MFRDLAARSHGEPGVRLMAARTATTLRSELAWQQRACPQFEFAAPLAVQGVCVVVARRQRQRAAENSLQGQRLRARVLNPYGARHQVQLREYAVAVLDHQPGEFVAEDQLQDRPAGAIANAILNEFEPRDARAVRARDD